MDVLLSSVFFVSLMRALSSRVFAAPREGGAMADRIRELRRDPLSSPSPALHPCNGLALQRISGSWCSPHRRAEQHVSHLRHPMPNPIRSSRRFPEITLGPEGGDCCHNAAFQGQISAPSLATSAGATALARRRIACPILRGPSSAASRACSTPTTPPLAMASVTCPKRSRRAPPCGPWRRRTSPPWRAAHRPDPADRHRPQRRP